METPGEIVPPTVADGALSRDAAAGEDDASSSGYKHDPDRGSASPIGNVPLASQSPLNDRRPPPKKTFRKDEFGRDVEVTVEDKRSKKSKASSKKDEGSKSHKHKHKREHKHGREGRRSKNKRKKLLEWFCNRFDPALDGGDLLESECGADIALFLPRLLSWMQKTTASVVNLSSDSSDAEPRKTKCFVLSEQVACLQVFFKAANVQSYYREFQQAGGLQLLLKIVALPGNHLQSQQPLISTTDRGTLLRIILRISQMNRSCKEEISRLDGELAVIRGVLASSDGGDWKTESGLWTLCREVLLEQLVGNPNGLDRAHAAVVFMLEHPETHLQLFGAQRPQSLKWLAAAITMRYIFVNHRQVSISLTCEYLICFVRVAVLSTTRYVAVQTAAVCLAELFAVPVAVLLSWKDSKSDDGQLLAEVLLHGDDRQRQLALKFYQRGWYRPLDPRRQPEQDDTDRVLNDIQYSLETAARDYIPELQVESRISEDDDDVDEMETLEAHRERRLRVQLQKHFAKFRSVSTGVAIGGS
ncbi:hypothetical protein BBJ28_00010073 [Nothophytophthora sp. Chile5]|nr:hypothetical protein BBJ28_00010073 [Nothophytophthora sp. Chile5]